MPTIFGASCPSSPFLCLSRKFHMKSSAETNTIGIVRKLCFFCQWWVCAFKPSFLRTSFIMYIKSQETVKTSPLSHKADVRERPFHLLKPVPSCKPPSALSSTSLPRLNGSFIGYYLMGVGACPVTEFVSELALHWLSSDTHNEA